MGLKIDVLLDDGSPLGVTERSLMGEDGRIGIGGAEQALLTLCSAWKYFGNDVTLYNDPRELNASSFEQRAIASFNPQENRDILIIFRSPNPISYNAKGFKLWWSCDQFTIDSFKDFASTVQKIVTISPYHSDYFKRMYGIENSIPIDIPIRTWEYKSKVEKIPKRCIFTSIPDRGLLPLCAAWAQIVAQVPDASLAITSDWRLWDSTITDEPTRPYRLAFAGLPNVQYYGAIKRSQLVQLQLEAEVHLYPCVYEELFCISVAESQVAGVLPITSDAGALRTTNMGWNTCRKSK